MYSSLLIAFCLVIVASAAPKRLRWQRLIDPIREEEGKVNYKIKFPSLKELDDEWQSFKSNYGKTYDEEEEMTRSKIFDKRFKAIIKHNYLYKKGLKSFTMGINEFSDLEHSEFVEMMTCYNPHRSNRPKTVSGSANFTPVVNNDLPSEFDWRKKGAVTEVKNQNYQNITCGACYAFSAAGTLEGEHFLKTGKLESLSAQQIVDCSKKFHNLGCKGGYPKSAFDYIKSVHGLESEQSYPYTAEEGKCEFDHTLIEATCMGYKRIASGSELELQKAVARFGPVSVSIDARQPSYLDYKTGVYNEPKCKSGMADLTHSVLVVGYGTAANGDDYWIVKDSIGTTWGMDGYMWMPRNKNNQCGIATDALFALI